MINLVFQLQYDVATKTKIRTRNRLKFRIIIRSEFWVRMPYRLEGVANIAAPYLAFCNFPEVTVFRDGSAYIGLIGTKVSSLTL